MRLFRANDVAMRGMLMLIRTRRADQLQSQAHQFKKGATKIRKQMWWKNVKLNIIIACVVILILIIIIGALERRAGKEGCRGHSFTRSACTVPIAVKLTPAQSNPPPTDAPTTAPPP